MSNKYKARNKRSRLDSDDSPEDGESDRTVDKRNKLNDLSSTRWVEQTKDVWYSRPPARDPLKIEHPATFAETDIERLINFFSKRGQLVLDPFVGVGSTLLACISTGRKGVGIELVPKWADIARQRVARELHQTTLDPNGWEGDARPEKSGVEVIEGDALEKLGEIPSEHVDFIVTSPPYWKILTKANDHKSKAERVAKGVDTKYSEAEQDLGNIESYPQFRDTLKIVWKECLRILRPEKYICIIVGDFRDGPRYVQYHADIAHDAEEVGFVLKGRIVLVQDNKHLYPYGYPFSFVPNVCHQNILVLRKDH